MVSLALAGKSAKRVFALGDPAIHRDKQTSASADRGPRASPEYCARSLRDLACFVSLSFAGLVVLARSLNPIPSRTRPLNSSAPMVLWLKPWESRSLPGLPRTKQFLFTCHDQTKRRILRDAAFFLFGVSSVAGGGAIPICFGHDLPPESSDAVEPSPIAPNSSKASPNQGDFHAQVRSS